MSGIDTARTVVAIVSAAVGVALIMVFLVIIGAFRERKLMSMLENQADRIREIEVGACTCMCGLCTWALWCKPVLCVC